MIVEINFSLLNQKFDMSRLLANGKLSSYQVLKTERA